jgi:hypothetical protein
MLACLSFVHYNSWWFMCFGWWGYYLEICYIMVIWKLLASLIHKNKVFSSLLLNFCALSLNDKILYMHLCRGSFILNWVLIASIFLKLIAYMLSELISESSLYLVYFVGSNILISLLCVVINYQQGGDWSI